MLFVSCLKLFSFFEIFTFLSWLFYVNGLIRSLGQSQNLWHQTGQQVIAIHILSNISRSKVNQTIKFSQLIQYKMRNIFLEKSYTQCVGKGSPRPLHKKSKLTISLDQQSRMFINSVFMSKSRFGKIY